MLHLNHAGVKGGMKETKAQDKNSARTSKGAGKGRKMSEDDVEGMLKDFTKQITDIAKEVEHGQLARTCCRS